MRPLILSLWVVIHYEEVAKDRLWSWEGGTGQVIIVMVLGERGCLSLGFTPHSSSGGLIVSSTHR